VPSTGLTGAFPNWVLAHVKCLVRVTLGCGVAGQFLVDFKEFLLGFVKVSLLLQFEFWKWFLLQGLEESLSLPEKLLCNYCSHRPDRHCPPV
jgi:hypothetical protein